MVQVMSLMDWYRKNKDEITCLREENRILKEEIIFLKKILYGIELDKE